jgi:ABC-type amino acid transport substrate-binding protein
MSRLMSGSSIFCTLPQQDTSSRPLLKLTASGVKMGTLQNSPSDRFLTRPLKSAERVRLPLSSNMPADAIELLRSGKADAFAADFGLIETIASGYPEAKVVPGAFNTGAHRDSATKGKIGRGSSQTHRPHQ